MPLAEVRAVDVEAGGAGVRGDNGAGKTGERFVELELTGDGEFLIELLGGLHELKCRTRRPGIKGLRNRD